MWESKDGTIVHSRGIRQWMTLTPSLSTSKFEQSLVFNASCMRCGASITTENEATPSDNSPVAAFVARHGDDLSQLGATICEQEQY